MKSLDDNQGSLDLALEQFRRFYKQYSYEFGAIAGYLGLVDGEYPVVFTVQGLSVGNTRTAVRQRDVARTGKLRAGDAGPGAGVEDRDPGGEENDEDFDNFEGQGVAVEEELYGDDSKRVAVVDEGRDAFDQNDISFYNGCNVLIVRDRILFRRGAELLPVQLDPLLSAEHNPAARHKQMAANVVGGGGGSSEDQFATDHAAAEVLKESYSRFGLLERRYWDRFRSKLLEKEVDFFKNVEYVPNSVHYFVTHGKANGAQLLSAREQRYGTRFAIPALSVAQLAENQDVAMSPTFGTRPKDTKMEVTNKLSPDRGYAVESPLGQQKISRSRGGEAASMERRDETGLGSVSYFSVPAKISGAVDVHYLAYEYQNPHLSVVDEPVYAEVDQLMVSHRYRPSALHNCFLDLLAPPELDCLARPKLPILENLQAVPATGFNGKQRGTEVDRLTAYQDCRDLDRLKKFVSFVEEHDLVLDHLCDTENGLAEMMHKFGVKVKDLGRVQSLAGTGILHDLCALEAFARTVKNLLRERILDFCCFPGELHSEDLSTVVRATGEGRNRKVRELTVDLFNELFRGNSLTFWERIVNPLARRLFPDIVVFSWHRAKQRPLFCVYLASLRCGVRWENVIYESLAKMSLDAGESGVRDSLKPSTSESFAKTLASGGHGEEKEGGSCRPFLDQAPFGYTDLSDFRTPDCEFVVPHVGGIRKLLFFAVQASGHATLEQLERASSASKPVHERYVNDSERLRKSRRDLPILSQTKTEAQQEMRNRSLFSGQFPMLLEQVKGWFARSKLGCASFLPWWEHLGYEKFLLTRDSESMDFIASMNPRHFSAEIESELAPNLLPDPNENVMVSPGGKRYGDNQRLAAQIANAVENQIQRGRNPSSEENRRTMSDLLRRGHEAQIQAYCNMKLAIDRLVQPRRSPESLLNLGVCFLEAGAGLVRPHRSMRENFFHPTDSKSYLLDDSDRVMYGAAAGQGGNDPNATKPHSRLNVLTFPSRYDSILDGVPLLVRESASGEELLKRISTML